MKELSLPALSRIGTGKGVARRTRMAGNIPAIMYGPELNTPMAISVPEREFRSALKTAGGTNAIFNLTVDGKSSKTILRQVQRDPVTSRVTHLDFHAISMTKPLHIKIPVHVIGTAIGVKAEGGIMNLVHREIEISCLPTNIPEFVEVDVSALGIGDSIHIGALSIPNATILDDADDTLVVITAPTTIKVEVPTAEEAAATAAAAAAAPGAPGAVPAAGAAPAAGGKAPAAGGKAPAAGAKAPAAAPAKGGDAKKK